MLSVLMTKQTKGHKETLEGAGYVDGLDRGDGVMGLCMCPNRLSTYSTCRSLPITCTSIMLIVATIRVPWKVPGKVVASRVPPSSPHPAVGFVCKHVTNLFSSPRGPGRCRMPHSFQVRINKLRTILAALCLVFCSLLQPGKCL